MTTGPDMSGLFTTIFSITIVFCILIIAGMYGNDWRKKRYEEMLSVQKSERDRDVAAARLQEQDETMDRISYELHNGVCQQLQLLKMQLRKISATVPAATHLLLAAIEDTGNLSDRIRALSHSMNSKFVKETGLVDFLQQQVLSLNLSSAINSSFKLTGAAPPLLPETELDIMRIAQELIHNAMRHSGASQINIALISRPESITLQIRDNGSGAVVDTLTPNKGMGKSLMYDRARSAGAELSLTSVTGEGTTASLHISLATEAS